MGGSHIASPPMDVFGGAGVLSSARPDREGELVPRRSLGNISAAYSEPLLCRLDVQCVVDLSGTRPAQVPAAKKSCCPCTCPLTTPHHRSRLCIDIPDSEGVDMTQFGSEVTRFIHAAHLKGKNVLVHSYKGQNRAPAFVTLYLMTVHRMPLSQALTLVHESYAPVALNRCFLNTLKEVDRSPDPPLPKTLTSPLTRSPSTTTITTSTNTSTTATHSRIRTAWT